MKPLEAAILRTVLYADVFDFALTPAEIHRFLVHNTTTTREEINQTLESSVLLHENLVIEGGHIARCREVIAERARREEHSARLWPLAMRYGVWLGRLPFVHMVALTGALAVRNPADSDDDLDYLIVTAPHRVWLARAFAIVVVRLVRLRGIVICPNYVLADDALEQDRKDLFVAHEVAQMIPICGEAHYWRFREANRWVETHLPNAQVPFYAGNDRESGSLGAIPKRMLEFLLGGRIGDWLEEWEYRRKAARFSAALRSPQSAAQIDRRRVKGHFNDYGHPALRQYYERLRAYGLEDDVLAATGD